MESRMNLSDEELLIHILDKLILLHRNLIGILEEEYAHMISVDADGLFEVTKAKELLINEIMNYENKRVEVGERIAQKNNFKSKEKYATLTELAPFLKNVSLEKLNNYKTVLQLLVKRSKEQNERNMSFARQSLQRIETMKRNVLGHSGNNNENYSKTGRRQYIQEHGGRFLSTKA